LRAGSTDSAGLMESCPLEAIAGSGDCQALARSGGYEDGLCRGCSSFASMVSSTMVPTRSVQVKVPLSSARLHC
jgi:hypothetical protein